MRLIDADELRKNVLKWMPSDPCGKEEKEFPFETDICASMVMEIDDAPTVQPDTTTHDSIPAETGKNDGDKTSGDCISRQAAKDIFTELYGISAIGSAFDKEEWADICETTANELPSAQPERKTGRWIQLTCDNAEWWYCSECNGRVQMNPWAKYNYCPNCGTDMRSEQNE